jgi:hypothetical protein
MLSSVACPDLPYSFILSHKRHTFRKKVIEHIMCVLCFSTTFVRSIFHSKKKWATYDQNVKSTGLLGSTPHYRYQTNYWFIKSPTPYMNLRHRTLGLYSSVQHRHHSALPIKNAPVNNQCPMVCYKPVPASRPAHPTRSNGTPGTNSHTPHHSECPPTPTHEIADKPPQHPTPQTKMDFWRNNIG